MYIYLKYLLFIIGGIAAYGGICNNSIAAAIVSAGSFLAFAFIEIRDLKTLNDDNKNGNN